MRRIQKYQLYNLLLHLALIIILGITICDVIYEKVPQVGKFIFELMIALDNGRFCEQFAKKIFSIR